MALGNVVGASSIPNSAFGVVVEARPNWRPFLLGVIGVVDWEAACRGDGRDAGRSIGGGVMPVGIQNTTYDGLVDCPIVDITTASTRT